MQDGDVLELAERMLMDLRSLDVIFSGRPHEIIEMRKIIKLLGRKNGFSGFGLTRHVSSDG